MGHRRMRYGVSLREMRESYAALQVAQRRKLIGVLDAALEDRCQRLIARWSGSRCRSGGDAHDDARAHARRPHAHAARSHPLHAHAHAHPHARAHAHARASPARVLTPTRTAAPTLCGGGGGPC